MERIKENVIDDFHNMIINSWTYDKMTKLEKETWIKVLKHVEVTKCLRGTYEARWSILQAVYHSYLLGLGYTDFNWREEV